jgi:hypothetical protein
VILVTAKLPRGPLDLIVLANSYAARPGAYPFLLTETHPPFQREQTRSGGMPEPPAAQPSSAPQPTPAPRSPTTRA